MCRKSFLFFASVALIFHCRAHFGSAPGGVTINGVPPIPIGGSLSEGVWDEDGVCSASGIACQNCSHLVTCVPLPGGWMKVPLIGCREGFSCDFSLRKCTNGTQGVCNAVRRTSL